jgi:hypothetical protein
MDHPLADNGQGTVYQYQTVAGTLYGVAGRPQYTDIQQGTVGDCYMLAGLAETAMHSEAAIESMFTDNGDGTFTVRFYNQGKADYVTVDRMLPAVNGQLIFDGLGMNTNDRSNTLWVMLAEKAYAQLNESGWLRAPADNGGINSYQAIADGDPTAALSQITGRASTGFLQLNHNAIVQAFQSGQLVVFGSMGSSDKEIDGNGVVMNHAYALVSYDAWTDSFTLYNPWGLGQSQAAGEVTLSWDQMMQSYAGWGSVNLNASSQAAGKPAGQAVSIHEVAKALTTAHHGPAAADSEWARVF